MFCCLDFGSSGAGTSDFPGNRKRPSNNTYFPPAQAMNNNNDSFLTRIDGAQNHLGNRNSSTTASSGNNYYYPHEHNHHHQQQDLHPLPAAANTTTSSYSDAPAPSAPPKDDLFCWSDAGVHHETWNAAVPSPSLVTNPTSPPQQQQYNTPVKASSQQRTRRVLVQVPAGVSSGSTLEIRVPENNQILQVTVPPNAKEFYVDYDPTMMTAKSLGASQSGNVVRPASQTASHNQGSGAFDETLLPIIGGAALLGTAGLLIGQHNRGGG